MDTAELERMLIDTRETLIVTRAHAEAVNIMFQQLVRVLMDSEILSEEALGDVIQSSIRLIREAAQKSPGPAGAALSGEAEKIVRGTFGVVYKPRPDPK